MVDGTTWVAANACNYGGGHERVYTVPTLTGMGMARYLTCLLLRSHGPVFPVGAEPISIENKTIMWTTVYLGRRNTGDSRRRKA